MDKQPLAGDRLAVPARRRPIAESEIRQPQPVFMRRQAAFEIAAMEQQMAVVELRPGVAGIERHRLVEGSSGFVEASEFAQRHGPGAMDGAAGLAEGDGLVQRLDLLVEAAEAAKCCGTGEVSVGAGAACQRLIGGGKRLLEAVEAGQRADAADQPVHGVRQNGETSLVGGARLFLALERGERVAANDQRVAIVAIAGQRRVDGRQRRGRTVQPLQRGATAEIGLAPFGPEPQRQVEGLQRRLALPETEQRESPVEMRLGEARFQPPGPFIGHHRLRRPAHRLQRVAAVEMRQRIGGAKRNGGIEGGERFVQPPEVLKRDTPAAMGFRELRRQRQRGVEGGEPFVQFAGPQIGIAENVLAGRMLQCVAVARQLADRDAIFAGADQPGRAGENVFDPPRPLSGHLPRRSLHRSSLTVIRTSPPTTKKASRIEMPIL